MRVNKKNVSVLVPIVAASRIVSIHPSALGLIATLCLP